MSERGSKGPLVEAAVASDVRRGTRVRLRIESLAFGARGVARVGGYVVFVDGALPGQEVAAFVVRRRRDFAEAVLDEVFVTAPGQVSPECRHFGDCGGCALQHWDYTFQLEAKRRQVSEVLRRIGGIEGIEVAPTAPSPEVYGYRNKMEFSFSRRRWYSRSLEGALPEGAPADSGLAAAADAIELGDATGASPPVVARAPEPPAVGLHPRGRYERALEIEECFLGPPRAVQALRLVRRMAVESGLPAYSTRTHDGFWRFLVVREGRRTGDLLVNIVTNRFAPGSPEDACVRGMAAAIASGIAGVTGVVANLTANLASTAYGEEERLLFGRPEIREVMGGVTFEISANSFFQTNTLQAERLFTRLLEHAALTGHETVYDLYCGGGAISLLAAKNAARVIGIEASESAVADAGRNAALNGVTNVRFIAGDLRDALGREAPGLPAPDVVILDPPRAGAHPKTIADLARLSPPRILYVSCNPSTLARDLAPLAAAGYRAGTAEPFDMFPHTPHVEVLLPLVR